MFVCIYIYIYIFSCIIYITLCARFLLVLRSASGGCGKTSLVDVFVNNVFYDGRLALLNLIIYFSYEYFGYEHFIYIYMKYKCIHIYIYIYIYIQIYYIYIYNYYMYTLALKVLLHFNISSTTSLIYRYIIIICILWLVKVLLHFNISSGA